MIYVAGRNSVDAGNNDNWMFPRAVTLTLSGLEGKGVNVTMDQYGSPVSFLLMGDGTYGLWTDDGSTVEIEDLYTVSSTERFYTEDTVSWTADANVTASVAYYRQWKPTITFNGLDASHTVTAYYTTLGGASTQTNQYTSWSRWVDNGSALWFSKEATGVPTRHTGEDFSVPPWDPLTSALVRTVSYGEQVLLELRNGTLEPASGNTTTWFNFSVEYWDANNDAPIWIYVNIDGVNHSMEKVYPGDVDYTDGCLYHYVTRLTAGTHDYYYVANDSYGTNSTATETSGNVVPELPLVPVLTVVLVMAAVVARRRRKA